MTGLPPPISQIRLRHQSWLHRSPQSGCGADFSPTGEAGTEAELS
jgi:hypothetical protein